MMHWESTPYLLPLFGAAVVNAGLSIYAWRQRSVPSARAFAWLMLAVTEWSGAYIVEILSTSLAAKVSWAKLEYLGIASIPPLWLTFALVYTNCTRWLTRRNLVFAALIPALSILLVFTNEWHHLFWRQAAFGVSLQVRFGVWFWVHAGYSYLLLAAGVMLFVVMFLRSAQLYRRQIGLMVVGALIPWLANVLYLGGLNPLPVDLTPLGFTLTGLLFAYGLFRWRMLDIAPVARDVVIENMREGMLVLDLQDRVVDLNAAMQQILGASADRVIGQPAGEVLRPWREVARRFQTSAEAQAEIMLPQHGQACAYDLRIAPLTNRRGRLSGRVIVLRDVTEHKQAEHALQESEKRFKELAEATFEGVVIHDEGLVVDGNQIIGQMFGYELRELLQKNIFAFISPSFHALVAAKMALDDSPPYEIEGLRKDGSTFPIEVQARRTPYRGRMLRVVAVRDITERKQAEAALRYAHDVLRRRVQELATLNRIMQMVAATLDVKAMLTHVAQELLTFFNASATGIALLDAEQQTLTVFSEYAARPEWPATVGAQIVLEADSAFRQVCQEGKTVVVPQAQSNPRLKPAQDLICARQVQCIMLIPLIARGSVLGMLGLETDQPERKFTSAEVTLAETIAGPIANALENARLFAEERRQRQIAESLRRVATVINSTLDRDAVLDKIFEQLQPVIPYNSAAIFLADGDALVLVDGAFIAPHFIGRRLALTETDLAVTVFQQRASAVIADVRADPRWNAWTESLRIRSWMGAPLLVRDQVMGVLTTDNFAVGAYRAEDAQILQLFANQAAIAIQNAQLYQEMHREKQLFETLLLSSPVATVMADTADKIRLWNPAAERLFGYRRDEALGCQIDAIVNSPAMRSAGRACNEHVKGGRDVRLMTQRQRKDGTLVEVELSAVPVMAADQQIAVLSLYHDLTDIKRAEHALREAQQQLQASYQREQERRRLSETLREAIMIVSSTLEPRRLVGLLLDELQKVVTYHFASVMLVDGEQLTRLVRRNARGDSYRALTFPIAMYPLNAEVLREKRPIVIADVQSDARWKSSRETGDVRSLLNTPLLVQERPIGVLSIARSDLAAYTEEEANTVFAFATHVAIALENARLAEQTRITLVDLQDTLERLQRTQKRLIESEKMAALGKLVANIAHEINTPLGAIRASTTNITHALAETTQQLPVLLPQLTPTQQQAFWDFVVRAAQPKPALTTREERRQKRALCAALEAHGVSQAEEIADVLGDMGIFEAFTPYLALLQWTQAVELFRAASAVVMQRRNSENILTAVERMAKIIFALKTYAHYDPTGQKTETAITDGIDVVLTLYHNQLKQGVEVCKDYAAVPPLRCYPDELHQVWTNLLSNAIHAMQGKGRLEITVETRCIASLPEGVVVSITDSGGGIPDDIKARIFEPFFTTKPAGEGSGLGLDICRKIIDKHQGKIEVESQPGRTTFTVFLPIVEPQTAESLSSQGNTA